MTRPLSREGFSVAGWACSWLPSLARRVTVAGQRRNRTGFHGCLAVERQGPTCGDRITFVRPRAGVKSDLD